jgi:glycosyl transferase family 2
MSNFTAITRQPVGDPAGSAAPQVYRNLVEAFEMAWRIHPGLLTQAWYRLAGRAVSMRIVGRRLAEAMDAPLRHLRCTSSIPAPAALRIDLWDEAETGVSCAGCDPHADPAANGQILSSEDGRFVVHARPRTRTGLDRRESHLVGWAAGAARLTLYELGRPLHAQLLLWLSDRRVQPVHAGLVALEEGGVLLGGPGGSGKTTVALSCLQAGLRYLADDYVGLEESRQGSFVGHSLYVSTHVEPGHLRRFPSLLPHAVSGHLPGELKSLVLLPRVFPDRYADHAPIRAIALPIVTGQPRTSWRLASIVETLLRLAPSSLFMLPHVEAGWGFQVLSALAEQVPAFWLELGTDLPEIPSRVLLQGVTSMAPLVTCIVPVFNGERYLGEALDSILGQTHRAIEIIVVDDGSSDGSAALVARYGDRVRYLYQDNAGPAAAMNRGVQERNGEYVGFLAADDLWVPDKLARQLERFRARPELDLSVAHILNFWIPELAEEARRFAQNRLARPIPGYSAITLLARSRVFEQVGLFRPELQHGNDLDWFLRAGEAGAVLELMPDVLALRRLHHSNRSRHLADNSRDTFLGIIKGSLDRRRARPPAEEP